MGNKGLALATAAVLAALSAPALAGVNLVANGDFGGTPGQINYNTTLPDWTVTGTFAPYLLGYAFIFDNSNTFTMTDGSVGPPSSGKNLEGFKTLPLWGTSADGSPEPPTFYGVDSTYHPSDLTQTISGLKPGAKYIVSFDYAAGQQYGYSGATTDTWWVSLGGGTPQATTTIDLPSHGFSGWFEDSMTFTATGTSDVLSFVDVGTCKTTVCGPTNSGAPPFSLLDSVSMTAVPEASTWAMMALGFAGLGYAGFRRRTPISLA